MDTSEWYDDLMSASGRRKDMEFLPAAIAILETPQSPIRIAFIWFICIFVCAAILWSWFGKFDIVATAQGKIQPVGRVKIIQSIQSGKTKSASVANGKSVAVGDVLVQLDDTEIKADEQAKRTSLETFRAEVFRRQAFLDTLSPLDHNTMWDETRRKTIFPSDLPKIVPENIRAREQAVLRAELRAIIASLDGFAAQRIQRQTEIDGLHSAVSAQVNLTHILGERVELRSHLVSSSAGPRVAVIDAMQEHQEALAVLADKQAQLRSAEAAFAVASTEGYKLLETSLADNMNRKLEAERRVDELEQEVIKAQKQRELMTIRSPIAGTVQLSAITTAGQVITPGQELMRIVPVDAKLEIEAFVANKDIGFIAEGQSAIVKVEAYPFTRFGVLGGRVIRLSSDAVPEPDAQQMESTVTQNATSTIPTGNVPRVQNLVFPATVSLDSTTIVVGDQSVPLHPGMAVTVEIKTGKRRILEYLFSPLAQISSEAMNER